MMKAPCTPAQHITVAASIETVSIGGQLLTVIASSWLV